MRSDEELLKIELGGRRLPSYKEMLFRRGRYEGHEISQVITIIMDKPHPSVGWFYNQSTYRKEYKRIYYLRHEFGNWELSDVVQRAACCDWLLEQGDETAAKKLRRTLRHAWTRKVPSKRQNEILKALRGFFSSTPDYQNLRVDGTWRLVWNNVSIRDIDNQVRNVCHALRCHYSLRMSSWRLAPTLYRNTPNHHVEIIVPKDD